MDGDLTRPPRGRQSLTCFDRAWEDVDTVNLVLSEMELDKGAGSVSDAAGFRLLSEITTWYQKRRIV